MPRVMKKHEYKIVHELAVAAAEARGVPQSALAEAAESDDYRAAALVFLRMHQRMREIEASELARKLEIA